MLELNDVHKRYGRVVALSGLTLRLHPGEVYGLLGPNGAGKSTALKVATGLVAADAGSVRLEGMELGRDRRRALSRVGALIESPAFYGYLSARRNLELLEALQQPVAGSGSGDQPKSARYASAGQAGPAPPDPAPATTIAAALRKVGLAGRADDKVGGYSTGMRQRLGIAAALLGSPRLLILDEPTAGLDPEGRESILRLIRALVEEHRPTVLFTSHVFDEVARLCDRVGILRAGSLVHEGPVDDAEALRRIYFTPAATEGLE